MRGRRNTSLSVSSDGSASSSDYESTTPPLGEKALWSSPPDSPTLPMPVIKGNSKPSLTSRRLVVAKILASICAVAIVWQLMSGCTMSVPAAVVDHSTPPPTHELVGADNLPDHPTAVVVTGSTGSPKWTMSIPHNRHFPLHGNEYRAMCSHGDVLHDQVAQSIRPSRVKQWLKRDRYSVRDMTFLQVHDAIKTGILPKSRRENLNGVCDTSLTYVLGEDDASFGKSLLLLWMTYGLAKKEGRSFFIDDSQWAWGKYSAYFRPAPSPQCTRPPPHHIVPCPHSAKHLVVSSATASWIFGQEFESHFTPSHRYGLAKQSRVFKLLRTGYEDLFKLAAEDHKYVEERVANAAAAAAASHGPVVGLQIRRGDLPPFEFQYNMDYLPLERYADGVRSYMHRHYPVAGAHPLSQHADIPIMLASDDPEMFASSELHQAVLPLRVQRAQDRILLATKATLAENAPVSDTPDAKHLDENLGWEGGFYTSLFFSLGGGSGANARETGLQLREYVGRAYLMDLAVLSRADGVVCAVSSASCRALGVMMGWDALKQGRWVNVDDNRAWSWSGYKL